MGQVVVTDLTDDDIPGVKVPLADEGVGGASAPGAGGAADAADAVDVLLGVLGHVVVDDVLEVEVTGAGVLRNQVA